MKYLLLFAISFLTFSCKTPDKILDSKQLDTFLSARLVDTAGTISLVDYNEFSWDKMYVFPPYSRINENDELLSSVDLNSFPATLTLDDWNCTLVFFNKKHFVGHMKIDRKIDFARLGLKSPPGYGYSYNRPDCIFKYHETPKFKNDSTQRMTFELTTR